MRDELRQRDNHVIRVRATVSKFGLRATVLLADGVDAVTGAALFDHIWLSTGEWTRIPHDVVGWRALRAGEVIEFDARAAAYLKGYLGPIEKYQIERPASFDWGLVEPQNLSVVAWTAPPKKMRQRRP